MIELECMIKKYANETVLNQMRPGGILCRYEYVVFQFWGGI